MRRLGLAFLWLLWRWLPLRALAGAGSALGGALFFLAPGRRQVAETNLRLCFPEWDAGQRQRILKAHFRALGRATLLETISWWGSRADVENLTHLEGTEHFLAHAGKPVIWLAPHFLGLNIGGIRVTAAYAPIVSLYATIKNPHLDRLMLGARTRFSNGDNPSEMYSRHDGIRPVIRAMRRGRPFYYLPDLDYGLKDALFIPFFGVPAATVTGLSRIARATGARVIPCVTRWEVDHYVTRFYPVWADFPSSDVAADTRRMNAFIEERVREMPEQYFWVHKRFKTQPEGKKGRIYED